MDPDVQPHPSCTQSADSCSCDTGTIYVHSAICCNWGGTRWVEHWLTCDDHVKVLQPVFIPLRPHPPSQQEVHHHMSIVPQRIGGHKHLLACCPVHFHDAHQTLILMDILGWILCNCLLQAAVSVAQVYRSPHIPAHIG